MSFDIHQPVFDSRTGEYLEKKAIRYQEQLMQLFEKSPEGEALRSEGIEPGWTNMMIEFGITYLSVTPPRMSATNLREILFDLIPRKVSASADEAPEIIRELQSFWRFMQREFHLENADACLKVLDDRAARRLQKEMSNPANFGIAKSFVMTGMQRGFDMSTEEGIQKWMETYNAEQTRATGLPISSQRRTVRSTRKKNRTKKQ